MMRKTGADLRGKNIVIWGAGREGLAVAAFLRADYPDLALTFIDEGKAVPDLQGLADARVAQSPDAIAAALDAAELVIKSPGVSLYHPLLDKVRVRNVPITSLMNLWFSLGPRATTICVTGTKGKSTTAALLEHVLTKLGQRASLMGNIGTPLARAALAQDGFIIIEVSSYQAANFDGLCDIALLTSLYPEHLDWHKDLQRYYDDKLNLLRHARMKIITREAAAVMQKENLAVEGAQIVHQPSALHVENGRIYDGKVEIGRLTHPHLSRAHNLANICLVLTAVKELGFDIKAALAAMEDFQGLAHRQQELGVKDGLLFVDDSISTTPQSAIAALEVYYGRPITLIAGGFDRGIDFKPLSDYIKQKNVGAVIVMGPSGARIAELVTANGHDRILKAATMDEAVKLARQHTPAGGVVLLSPASPSYGLFKNFEERGRAFAEAAGL